MMVQSAGFMDTALACMSNGKRRWRSMEISKAMAGENCAIKRIGEESQSNGSGRTGRCAGLDSSP